MIRKIFLFVTLIIAMCSLAIGQQALVVTTTGSSIMLSYQKMDRVIRSSSGQAVIVYDGNTQSYTTQGTYASFVTSSGCNIVSFTEVGTSRSMAVPIANISQVLPTSSGKALIHVQDLLSGRVVRYEATNTFSSISAYIVGCSDQSGGGGTGTVESVSGLDRIVLDNTDPDNPIISFDSTFNSDRAILRVPQVGDNIGGDDIFDVYSWYYFAPPTISLTATSGSPFEVGTVNAITLSGTVTNPGAATLSSGVLNRTIPTPVTAINSFGAATTYTTNISYTPIQGGTLSYTQLAYSFQSSVNYTGSGESGTVTSPVRSLSAVYPVLYGVSTTDLTSTGDPYTALTKLVQAEGNKSVNMDGSGFIYYAVPSTWTDVNLSAIFDGNGFNVTPSFTSSTVSVTSSGLTNNWTLNYTIYKLNTSTTVSNATYTFNR